jgi:hypothetical protein
MELEWPKSRMLIHIILYPTVVFNSYYVLPPLPARNHNHHQSTVYTPLFSLIMVIIVFQIFSPNSDSYPFKSKSSWIDTDYSSYLSEAVLASLLSLSSRQLADAELSTNTIRGCCNLILRYAMPPLSPIYRWLLGHTTLLC